MRTCATAAFQVAEGNQGQSRAIKVHQGPMAISGNQWPLTRLTCARAAALRAALRSALASCSSETLASNSRLTCQIRGGVIRGGVIRSCSSETLASNSRLTCQIWEVVRGGH